MWVVCVRVVWWCLGVLVCWCSARGKPPVCTFKTPPCVLATGTHVFDMRACCRYTRRRPDRTHGGVLNVHTGRFLLFLFLSLSLFVFLFLFPALSFSPLFLSFLFSSRVSLLFSCLSPFLVSLSSFSPSFPFSVSLALAFAPLLPFSSFFPSLFFSLLFPSRQHCIKH